MEEKSSFSKIMSAASLATALPAMPIAMPMSAFFKALQHQQLGEDDDEDDEVVKEYHTGHHSLHRQ